MKKIKRILLFIAATLMVLNACHKNTGSSLVDISGFPLRAGDSWTYQVFDSINNTTDTAVFSITGSYTLNGGPVYFTTQTNISGVIVDSGLIIHSADSIIYQPAGVGLFSSITLLFPLAQGSHWHTRLFGDSVYVAATNLNLTVLNNNYDSVCNVRRTFMAVDLYINQNIYIAPGVGIIKQEYYMMGWIAQHKTLRLISYSL
jgi:hypothetical protein